MFIHWTTTCSQFYDLIGPYSLCVIRQVKTNYVLLYVRLDAPYCFMSRQSASKNKATIQLKTIVRLN